MSIANNDPTTAALDSVLTPQATELLSEFTRRYRPRIDAELHRRRTRQADFDAGTLPSFRPDRKAIRDDPAWRVRPAPADLVDRRVEITGPVDRKTVINALNSGAQVFMADFEDATSPTWANLIEGQRNLYDAVRGTIDFVAPDTGKQYRLNAATATLIVRPRGLHLPEHHCLVDGVPVPGALFDTVLYVAHNARELISRGSGPYLYLPKMESHFEAQLWAEILEDLEYSLGLPHGTIRVTVLIETLPAVFEMEEILFELRNHVVGLNCGRWDYLFSAIKTRRMDPSFVLPDRARLTMETPFMRAYARLLVTTCHRRGAHAIGGMAAQIPLREAAANAAALDIVRADKHREVNLGYDGTWVAHPGLVPVAREIFDAGMPWAHQLHRLNAQPAVKEETLLRTPEGSPTEEGVRHNIRVAIQYLAAWLGGRGCVPLYGLMEDAATAEISRTQIWQWLHHRVALDTGETVTPARVRGYLEEELSRLSVEAVPRLLDAAALFEEVTFADSLCDFITLPAYSRLVDASSDQSNS